MSGITIGGKSMLWSEFRDHYCKRHHGYNKCYLASNAPPEKRFSCNYDDCPAVHPLTTEERKKRANKKGGE